MGIDCESVAEIGCGYSWRYSLMVRISCDSGVNRRCLSCIKPRPPLKYSVVISRCTLIRDITYFSTTLRAILVDAVSQCTDPGKISCLRRLTHRSHRHPSNRNSMQRAYLRGKLGHLGNASGVVTHGSVGVDREAGGESGQHTDGRESHAYTGQTCARRLLRT